MDTTRRLLLLLLPLLGGAASCVWHIPSVMPSPIASVPAWGPGDHAGVVSLDANRPVVFGVDLMMTFDDLTSAQYTVDLEQNGFLVGRTTCDPIHVHYCSVHIAEPHSYNSVCRMDCVLRVPSSGPTIVRATFATIGTHVKIERARLMVAQ